MPRGLRYLANQDDRSMVTITLSVGLPVHVIAGGMGVPERTLRRHYPDVFRDAELKVGGPTYRPASEERDIVRAAPSRGMAHTDIAPLIGCSEGTLRKHFAAELKLGKAEANISVGAQLYKIATGDPTLATTAIAAIFWAKCHMGWRETRLAETDSEALVQRPQVARSSSAAPGTKCSHHHSHEGLRYWSGTFQGSTSASEALVARGRGGN